MTRKVSCQRVNPRGRRKAECDEQTKPSDIESCEVRACYQTPSATTTAYSAIEYTPTTGAGNSN